MIKMRISLLKVLIKKTNDPISRTHVQDIFIFSLPWWLTYSPPMTHYLISIREVGLLTTKIAKFTKNQTKVAILPKPN
jgi:hypothetical protein